jgi:RimJ/RimL family protein N-acetyltransferase
MEYLIGEYALLSMNCMVKLRKSQPGDARMLYEWANEPDVRKNSINKEKISWTEHISWFEGKLSDSNTYLYIAIHEDEPVGQIRFDRTNGSVEINYSVDYRKRGLGIGSDMLRMGIRNIQREIGPVIFRAKVLTSNKGSVRVFEKMNFELSRTFKHNEEFYFEYQFDGSLSV